MARQKVAVGVHKLLAEAVGLQTEQEPQVQLVHYLAVEPVVLAIFMEAEEEEVATTEVVVAVLIPTVPATTLEPEEVDLLSLIRSTHQTSPTSLG
jgi:hypothetical protein